MVILYDNKILRLYFNFIAVKENNFIDFKTVSAYCTGRKATSMPLDSLIFLVVSLTFNCCAISPAQCHWILFTHSHQLQGIQHAVYSFRAQFLVLNLLIFGEINFLVVFKL